MFTQSWFTEDWENARLAASNLTLAAGGRLGLDTAARSTCLLSGFQDFFLQPIIKDRPKKTVVDPGIDPGPLGSDADTLIGRTLGPLNVPAYFTILDMA